MHPCKKMVIDACDESQQTGLLRVPMCRCCTCCNSSIRIYACTRYVCHSLSPYPQTGYPYSNQCLWYIIIRSGSIALFFTSSSSSYTTTILLILRTGSTIEPHHISYRALLFAAVWVKYEDNHDIVLIKAHTGTQHTIDDAHLTQRSRCPTCNILQCPYETQTSTVQWSVCVHYVYYTARTYKSSHVPVTYYVVMKNKVHIGTWSIRGAR